MYKTNQVMKITQKSEKIDKINQVVKITIGNR